MPIKEIDEWKEQWNNGDVKFVPELFELAEDLLSTHERLREKAQHLHDHHIHVMKQLEAQNKALTEQLVRMELLQPRQIVIQKEDLDPKLLEDLKLQMSQRSVESISITPEVEKNREFLDELQYKVITGLGVPKDVLDRIEKGKQVSLSMEMKGTNKDDE